MSDFKQLQVWQRAHALTLAVYHATNAFPREEAYGLTGQIRRSAASVPANIAEGCGRGSNAELARFLRNPLGSSNELEYHLLLAHDLQLLSPQDHNRLLPELVEVRRMLTGLIQSLTRTQSRKAS